MKTKKEKSSGALISGTAELINLSVSRHHNHGIDPRTCAEPVVRRGANELLTGYLCFRVSLVEESRQEIHIPLSESEVEAIEAIALGAIKRANNSINS